jgi:hypothetical protein
MEGAVIAGKVAAEELLQVRKNKDNPQKITSGYALTTKKKIDKEDDKIDRKAVPFNTSKFIIVCLIILIISMIPMFEFTLRIPAIIPQH